MFLEIILKRGGPTNSACTAMLNWHWRHSARAADGQESCAAAYKQRTSAGVSTSFVQAVYLGMSGYQLCTSNVPWHEWVPERLAHSVLIGQDVVKVDGQHQVANPQGDVDLVCLAKRQYALKVDVLLLRVVVRLVGHVWDVLAVREALAPTQARRHVRDSR